MNQTISEFSSYYSFLSNFYPDKIVYEGLEYSSVECAYQASKLEPGSFGMEDFTKLNSFQAKKLGRSVLLRTDWEKVKLKIMEDLLIIKFSKDPLKNMLIKTGNSILVEGNYWHDNFWGVCNCDKCNSMGLNILGRLLMKIRENLKISDDNKNDGIKNCPRCKSKMKIHENLGNMRSFPMIILSCENKECLWNMTCEYNDLSGKDNESPKDILIKKMIQQWNEGVKTEV